MDRREGRIPHPMTPGREMDAKVVEALAALEHERWSGWMRYLFSKCFSVERQSEPHYAIIASYAERWERQMNTPYADLSEQEKESDRVEARKTLAALQALGAGVEK